MQRPDLLRDGDLVLGPTQDEGQAEHHGLAHREGDPRPHERAEPIERDAHVVRPDRQRREREVPRRVGEGVAHEAALDVPGGDLGARQGRLRLGADLSLDGARRALGMGERGPQRHDRDPRRLPHAGTPPLPDPIARLPEDVSVIIDRKRLPVSRAALEQARVQGGGHDEALPSRAGRGLSGRLRAGPRRPGRGLAAVAWPRAHRREPGAEPPGAVERDRERPVEAAPAERERLDAGGERRKRLPERGRRARGRAVVRGEALGPRLVEASARTVRGATPTASTTCRRRLPSSATAACSR